MYNQDPDIAKLILNKDGDARRALETAVGESLSNPDNPLGSQLSATIAGMSHTSFPRRADGMTSPQVARRHTSHDERFITTFSGVHGWTASNPDISFQPNQTPGFGPLQAQYGPVDAASNMHVESPHGLDIDLSENVLTLYLQSLDHAPPTITVYVSTDSGYAQSSFIQIGPGDYPNDYGVVALTADLRTATGGSADLSNINRIRVRFDRAAQTGVTTVRLLAVSIKPAETRPTFVIGFDDSGVGVSELAAPVLNAAKFPAMVFAIGEASDAQNAPLNVQRLHELEELQGWEVGGHAATFGEHVHLTTLSDTDLRAALANMKDWLNRNDFRGYHFAYPHGTNDARVRKVTAQYFSTARGVGGGVVPSAKEVGAPRHRIFSIPSPSYDMGEFNKAAALAAIARASEFNLTLVLTFHTVVASGAAAGGAINVSDFEDIVAAIEATDGRVTTLSGLYDL